jgi:hypothetical protein
VTANAEEMQKVNPARIERTTLWKVQVWNHTRYHCATGSSRHKVSENALDIWAERRAITFLSPFPFTLESMLGGLVRQCPNIGLAGLRRVISMQVVSNDSIAFLRFDVHARLAM